MVRGLSDYHIRLCKVRLVGAGIKKKEVEKGGMRIKREELRKHQYTERYTRCPKSKKI